MRRLAIVSDPEPDPFPFTEDELFQAFCLVTDEQAARIQAREVIVAVGAEPRWEMSDESLALLALGSTSAAAKVELIRSQRDADRQA